MASAGTRTVSYDERGNVMTLGAFGFLCDMVDHPRAVSGASNRTYGYNSNLRRVKAVVDDLQVTAYLELRVWLHPQMTPRWAARASLYFVLTRFVGDDRPRFLLIFSFFQVTV